jgi:Domain of unknown function (DU1801)
MAELKTRVTKASVSDFLNGIPDERRRRDCLTLVDVMEKATKLKPEMWGSAIVGFGRYRYKYPSGREGEWFVAGFSPRKQNLTLYILPGIERYSKHLQKLGRHTIGRSCLYVKTLDDVHMPTLKTIVKEAFKDIKQYEAR